MSYIEYNCQTKDSILRVLEEVDNSVMITTTRNTSIAYHNIPKIIISFPDFLYYYPLFAERDIVKILICKKENYLELLLENSADQLFSKGFLVIHE